MKDKIRIGIVGCGRFARCFVPLFKAHPNVEKVYVCDIIPERAKNYSEQFDVPIIGSFEEMLESKEINAVAIFVQRFKHGEMAIKALKAGKHVYSSVPCAISVDEIIEIEKLVRETRLTYSMGETGFYRTATCFCREQYRKGNFGNFVYGEAQYNHDIRNMEDSYRSSGGEDWKKFAGIPPFFYPTHSTAMILGSMPGVYAKKVVGFGYVEKDRTDIFATDDTNNYSNAFSNEAMLMQLSNGGNVRICENRSLAWRAPETYISQFYGTEGCYEFSVAKHYMTKWDAERYGKTVIKDVSRSLMPPALCDGLENDYETTLQHLADGGNFADVSPIQPTWRLPKEFEDQPDGHNGTHKFLIDDFCKAVAEDKLSPTNIWQTARFNIPGLIAHESALRGGVAMDVPDLGDPPSDWPVLDFDK